MLEMLDHLGDRIPELAVLVTGGRLVRLPETVPDGVFRLQKPYDLPQSVDRFLDEQKPDAVVLTGSDLFPSAITACKLRGIPLALANASFRERSRLGERLLDFRLGARLRAFDRIFAVAEEDAEQFVRKGSPRESIDVVGPFEAMPPALPCDEGEREYLTRLLSTRPVLLAAALPEAEYPAVESAFRAANRQSHRLLLVVVPADPSKGAETADFFEDAGWLTARRENGEEPDQNVQIYIADAADEQGLWYRLAPLTFLGGTLTGQTFPDPMQPAALGSAVIHGAAAANGPSQLLRLAAEGATRPVADSMDLAAAVADLLAPDRAAALAGRAWDIISRGVESAERAAAAVAVLLKSAGQ